MIETLKPNKINIFDPQYFEKIDSLELKYFKDKYPNVTF